MEEVKIIMMQRAFRPARGGDSRRVEEFASLLSQNGVASVLVITLDNTKNDYPQDLTVKRVNGNPLHFLARWKLVLMTALTLLFQLKDRNVLFINAPFIECGPLVMFAKKMGIRVILYLTLMGQDSPSDLRKYSRYPRWFVIKMIHGLGSADLVLTMGEALREDALRYGWPVNHVKCIPHPKDEVIYHPVRSESERQGLRRSFGLPENSFVCGFVGFLVPRKGIAELAIAWKKFHSSHPEAKLAICGPIEENHSEWVNSILRKLTPNSFIYIGTLEAVRVGDFLRTLDLFVLPSHREGQPSALVEAMMTGLACVVTALQGSTTDLVVDGVSGILVPIKSPDKIVAAMERLFIDSSLRNSMGQQAYIRSKPFHSTVATGSLLRAFFGEKDIFANEIRSQ